MNNKTSIIYFVLMIIPLLPGCRGPVKEVNKDNASPTSISLPSGDEKYIAIDTKESVVTWKGSNLMGSNSHTGYVYLSKGALLIEKDQLRGGTAEVDMNTIEDESHRSDNGLIDHLKDPDFFDVKRFPVATISITKVESTNDENKHISGNLTIKGITHPVTFPVRVEVLNRTVNVNGRLVIDRAKWDIRYKSGKFYTLLADQTISDSIEFHINIRAKK